LIKNPDLAFLDGPGGVQVAARPWSTPLRTSIASCKCETLTATFAPSREVDRRMASRAQHRRRFFLLGAGEAAHAYRSVKA